MVTEGAEPSESTDENTEGTQEEEQQQEEAAPVDLVAADITFPEGVTVDEASRDEFLGILNNRELSPKEQAQALINLQMRTAQAASEASSNAWSEMQTQWREEVKADADVGGDKLQPALGRIGRLIDEYGSPEVSKIFDLTGAGNSVHVIKMLDKMAQKLTEGGHVSGSPTNQDQSAASRMYPSMPNP